MYSNTKCKLKEVPYIPEINWFFPRWSTAKCTTKPVAKIPDKLAIVFDETAFKAAFCLNHLTSAKLDLSTLKNIPLPPPSGIVSEHEQTQKLRMRYRISVIYRHSVTAASRALRFADHVNKRNRGDENGTIPAIYFKEKK